MVDNDYHAIRKDVDSIGNKINDLVKSVDEIKGILAETRGANIPARISILESRVSDIEKSDASNTIALKQIDVNTEDIKEIKTFQYKAVGAIAVINVILIVIGKFIMDKLFA